MTRGPRRRPAHPRHGSAHELGLLPRPPVKLGLCLLTLDVLGPTPALLVLGALEGMCHAPGVVLRVDGLLLVVLGVPLRLLVGLVEGLGVRVLLGLFLRGHGLAGLRGGRPVPLLGDLLLMLAPRARALVLELSCLLQELP